MPDYRYTPVNSRQKALLERLSTEFEYLEEFIATTVPVGRRRALALTKLEDAAMWAAKAVAKEVPQQNENPPLLTEPIN